MVMVLYGLFFLSGAAALVYQVAWARSLSLVFGGTHLAVTTVLSVFMGGLALGGWWFGRAAKRSQRPLRFYALLELGVAASAMACTGLLALFPTLYLPVGTWLANSPLLLGATRTVYATLAMLVPTTLMGGTLPVLARFCTTGGRELKRRLSLLYGINTFGAVAGTLATTFYLLPTMGLRATVTAAIAVNLLVGLIAWLMPAPSPSVDDSSANAAAAATLPPDPAHGLATARASHLVLLGIGVSGFAALGYEVLWTRVFTSIVGTSVYGFSIMLTAFLSGIAVGSAAFGIVRGRWLAHDTGRIRGLVGFGSLQIAIGAAALTVTYLLGALPRHAAKVQAFLAGSLGDEFFARQTTSFLIAFLYMVVPATLLGVAVPMAGVLHARWQRELGRGVGEVLAWNTVGAILGSAVSGYVLVLWLGMERALQVLAVLQAGVGIWLVLAHSSRLSRGVALGTTGLVLLALVVAPSWARAWDARFFAIYRNNQRNAFDSQQKIDDAIANTDVLFHREGINETISVIRPKGGTQAIIVNNKTVASTDPADMQCQRALGHVPMLLHPNPRRVFVLGMGTGVTVGSASVHPQVEQIVLAEIEPNVVTAARTFATVNHHVVDNPKLRVVLNDGRNFLATTNERFDVITADPIHPWARGSGYLYTREYFQLAASRLRPGGIMAQWLPIYELTPASLATVMGTFAQSFAHVAVWLTFWDIELIGSNTPLQLDEAALATRMAHEPIASDLAALDMGSARDLLSYVLTGTSGVRRFSADAVINTDDNLHLEFEAPQSIGLPNLMATNLRALAAVREPVASASARPGRLTDAAHAAWLTGGLHNEVFPHLLRLLRDEFPDHAPGRFLERRAHAARQYEPTPVAALSLAVLSDDGRTETMTLSAVSVKVGEERGATMFVDNARRHIFGQRYIDATAGNLDAALASQARQGLARIHERDLRLRRARNASALTRAEIQRIVDEALGEALPTAPAVPGTATQH